MYEFSQSQIFIFFFIIGIVIGILFDIFRVLRKNIKTPDLITYMQDILFLITSGILLLYGVIKLNNGEIRFYLFVAVFFGILIYSLTISNICVIILTVFVRICKKIILFPFFCYKNIINPRKKQK